MSELGPEARALLKAGREALRPTAADRERVLQALRAQTGAGADGASGGARPSAPNGLPWQAFAVIGVVAASGVGLLLSQAIPEDSPEPPAAARVPQAPARAVPPSASSAPARALERPVESMPAPAAPLPSSGARASRRSSDHLAEEVALLTRAETELHAGRFTQALRLLSEHARSFPRGALTEERIAARIQALCALGRNEEADAELARVSPGSLHAGQARRACPASHRHEQR